MAILTVAVLTTFSTTGYIVVIVALFIRYLLSRSHNQLTAVLCMAVIPVVLIAVIILAVAAGGIYIYLMLNPDVARTATIR